MGSHDEREDLDIYKVVVNQEEQYSIWPEYKDNPLGWTDIGKTGLKQECLAHIKGMWTDMRPLSLRNKMEGMRDHSVSVQKRPVNSSSEQKLVDKLCEGLHPVAISLRPEKTMRLFMDAIRRNYVHVRFTDTRGGTELGIKLTPEACELSEADFQGATGTVHIEGTLTLDYVKVRCLADINLITLEGTGRLVKV